MRMTNPPHPGGFVRTEIIEDRGLGVTDGASGCRMADPAHPGEIIRDLILPSYDLTVTAAAEVLGVSRPAFSTFVAARSPLSPDLASRIEKAFGVPVDLMARVQTSWDLARERGREAEVRVERLVPPDLPGDDGR